MTLTRHVPVFGTTIEMDGMLYYTLGGMYFSYLINNLFDIVALNQDAIL